MVGNRMKVDTFQWQYAILLEKIKKGLEAIQIWTEAKQYYEASNIKAGIDEANKKIKLLQTNYQSE